MSSKILFNTVHRIDEQPRSIVQKVLRVPVTFVIYWSDSIIVLAWLNSELDKWEIFVSNRIAEIQTLSKFSIWRHINSANIPADLVSKGLDPILKLVQFDRTVQIFWGQNTEVEERVICSYLFLLWIHWKILIFLLVVLLIHHVCAFTY